MEGKSLRLQGVCSDIDRFFSSNSELTEVSSKEGLSETKSAAQDEVQRLSQLNEELREELFAFRRSKKDKAPERNTTREASLKQERDRFEQDARSKKRRIVEMEDELAKLRHERDSLATELQEARERSRREEDRQKATEKNESFAFLEPGPELRNSETFIVSSDNALKSRVSELEQEVLYLRKLLKDWYPEHELSSQLRDKHKGFERQLEEFQQAKTELSKTREKLLNLEQDKVALQAALDVQQEALKECTDAKAEIARIRKDYSEYQKEIRGILENQNDDSEATPASLRSAWSHLHSQWTKESHKALDLSKQMYDAKREIAALKEKGHMSQVDLSLAEAQREDLRVKLGEFEESLQRLKAQNSVLREALTGKQLQSLPEELKDTSFREVRESKTESVKKEIESLKKEVVRLTEIEGKLHRVEGVNKELWQANKDLEKKVGELQTQSQEARSRSQEVSQDVSSLEDYDRRSTKILHLVRGPGENVSGDLEQQQAARQLERYKKATKKYVGEFREGIYHLLGWKVEMRGEGSSLRWHLTSRYQDLRQELVFQLRCQGSGGPEFDLLGTPWAEELQSDRQAMAYLEVYNSIPGFLAHLTTDHLAQQTFT